VEAIDFEEREREKRTKVLRRYPEAHRERENSGTGLFRHLRGVWAMQPSTVG
jgi:hypothetical protein